MNKAFFFETPNFLDLTPYKETIVGRLTLPAGNYIIHAKADVRVRDSHENPYEGLHATLKCEEKTDEIWYNLVPIIAGATYYNPIQPWYAAQQIPIILESFGHEANLCFQIAVKTQKTTFADLTILSIHNNSAESSLRVESAAISAFQLEELEIHHTFEVSDGHTFARHNTGDFQLLSENLSRIIANLVRNK